MKSAPAIAFECQPSRWLAAGIVAVWLFGLLAIALCGLAPWLRICLVTMTSAYAAFVLRRFLRPPFRQFAWHEAGHWRVRDRSDDAEHVAELRHAAVLGDLIVLSLRTTAAAKVSVVLMPDNCDADTRRRLRVRLARSDRVGLAPR